MNVRVLFVADGRSPIARGWIEPLIERGHEIHLASTFPAEPLPGLKTFHNVSVGFSSLGLRSGDAVRPPGGAGGIGMRAFVKHWLGPLTILPAARNLQKVVQEIDVDLVHALRIPFEGMLASRLNLAMPFVLSVWGNDFTLHAQTSPWMRWMTRSAVHRAGALHADCQRDIQLAIDWGLRKDAPTVVLPGGGGIDRELFRPGEPLDLPQRPAIRELLERIPHDAPVVINPRGFRAYVRNDTFFKSIDLVHEKHPEAHFLMPGMAGERRAEVWLSQLQRKSNAHALPKLDASEMAALYRRSWVMVSPSEHDGTPNTFLEAIASGCFPIVGNLESLREWIEPGQNGELIEASDAQQLAQAVAAAIEDPVRRARAQEINQALIDKRAARKIVTESVEAFYQLLLRPGTKA